MGCRTHRKGCEASATPFPRNCRPLPRGKRVQLVAEPDKRLLGFGNPLYFRERTQIVSATHFSRQIYLHVDRAIGRRHWRRGSRRGKRRSRAGRSTRTTARRSMTFSRRNCRHFDTAGRAPYDTDWPTGSTRPRKQHRNCNSIKFKINKKFFESN